MRNKERMFVLALAMSVILLLSGCVQIRVTITDTDSTETEKATAVTETDSAALREEILAAAEIIWTQIKLYAGSDYDAYAALYCDTSDEMIQNGYASDFQTAQRDKTSYAYHGYAEPYAMVAVSDYIVSGTHPNTNLSYNNPSELILKKQDGEWKLCYSDEALAAAEEFILDNLYPVDFHAASEAQRNCATFNPYLLALDSAAIYEGCSYQTLIYMWQQEDGSVVLGVWLENGTDVNVTVNTLTITVTDETLGTIVDMTFTEYYPVVAGASTVVYLTVPADQVQTGTAVWGSLNSSTDTTFL